MIFIYLSNEKCCISLLADTRTPGSNTATIFGRSGVRDVLMLQTSQGSSGIWTLSLAEDVPAGRSERQRKESGRFGYCKSSGRSGRDSEQLERQATAKSVFFIRAFNSPMASLWLVLRCVQHTYFERKN